MIELLKYILIWLFDKFDHHILDHRFHWICDKIGLSSWWNDGRD